MKFLPLQWISTKPIHPVNLILRAQWLFSFVLAFCNQRSFSQHEEAMRGTNAEEKQIYYYMEHTKYGQYMVVWATLNELSGQ